MLNEEGGIDPLEYRFYSTVDRVHVTATAWLGLTVACAQCHTHKYDPILHTDYYRFMACLNNADEPIDRYSESRHRGEAEENPGAKWMRWRQDWRTNSPSKRASNGSRRGAAEFASKNGAEGNALSDGSFLVMGRILRKKSMQSSSTSPSRASPTCRWKPFRTTILGAAAGPDSAWQFRLERSRNGSSRNRPQAKPQKIKFSVAEADFAQDGFPATHAIDGKPDTGWAILGGDGNRLHRHLILTLATPLELKKKEHVTIRLAQNYGSQHTLGRFRISLGNELPEPGATVERHREVRDRKLGAWVADEAQNASSGKFGDRPRPKPPRLS